MRQAVYTLMTDIFPSEVPDNKIRVEEVVAFRISNAWQLENHVFETLQQSEPRDTQRIEVTREDTNS
jgi:hypothetical protein